MGVEVQKVWLAFDLNRMSRKGVALFSLNPTANLIFSYWQCKNWVAVLFLLSNKVKVSSTYRNQIEGRALLSRTHFSSKWRVKILAKTGPSGRAHSHTRNLVIVLAIKYGMALLCGKLRQNSQDGAGRVGGSGKECNLSRQICIISLFWLYI